VRGRRACKCSQARRASPPSSGADPARGGVQPSSEADPARGVVQPSSEADLARGGIPLRRPGGSRRAARTVIVSRTCLGLWVDPWFAFFRILSGFPFGYLGDSCDCPDTGGLRQRGWQGRPEAARMADDDERVMAGRPPSHFLRGLPLHATGDSTSPPTFSPPPPVAPTPTLPSPCIFLLHGKPRPDGRNGDRRWGRGAAATRGGRAASAGPACPAGGRQQQPSILSPPSC
jgi:hypothetical protein